MKALPGHFIHGEWKTGAGLPLHSTNPATGERVFETCAATKSDIDDSFIAAKAALAHWRQTSLSDRIS